MTLIHSRTGQLPCSRPYGTIRKSLEEQKRYRVFWLPWWRTDHFRWHFVKINVIISTDPWEVASRELLVLKVSDWNVCWLVKQLKLSYGTEYGLYLQRVIALGNKLKRQSFSLYTFYGFFHFLVMRVFMSKHSKTFHIIPQYLTKEQSICRSRYIK